MPRQVSPAKAWCFTLNNYTEQEYEFLSSALRAESEKYFYIVGKEVGESGTPHLQGYVELKAEKKKFRPLPKFAIERDGKQAMHFERAKGSRQQNYVYCSKDGNFITNITPVGEQLEEAELTLQRALQMQDRISTLNTRIKETFDAINPHNDEDYEFARELCLADIEERDMLVEEFYNRDYDIAIALS